jgi:hypothetical protein
MRELAPLLAEEGIDLETTDLDPQALQQALDRAVKRRNLALFTPVGPARDLAIDLLRLAVAALIADELRRALDILDGAVPESPDTSTAEVSSCIGVALGLADDILVGRNPGAPPGLAKRLPSQPLYGPGDVSAPDILAFARTGQSFASIDRLIVSHGGRELLYGSANALATIIQAWSRATGASAAEVIEGTIR